MHGALGVVQKVINTVMLKINKLIKKLRVLKGRGVEVGRSRWWVIWRAWIAWSTGCGAKTMNTDTLKRNFKN